MTDVFTTPHGSRLYGLHHANSDCDTYTVTFNGNGQANHRVTEEFDAVRVDWRTFLKLASSGSHQSCEALFSRQKVWTPEGESLRPLIEGMYVTGSDVFEKYERTIKKFSHGDYKRRQHAVRLAMNLTGLRTHGRFDPELTEEQKRYARMMAEYSGPALARWLVRYENGVGL